MKRLVMILALVALSTPISVHAATWEIDPAHSRIGFKVKHLMISTVSGLFEKYRSIINIDDGALDRSTVSVVIDTASINTGIARRDEHLRSPDFFDVQKYPEMTFVGKQVIARGGAIQLVGDLTIRGITKTVVLTVNELTKPVKDPWGGERRGASATTEINRKDFGLVWNKTLETGGVVVGDQVKIEIDLELVRK